MPFGYLISTAIMATYVFFALRPPRARRSSPYRVSFWLGYLVNELPFLALYVLAASTALAIAQGDIATPVGWIGLGFAVLAGAGLVVVVLRALQTGEAVDDALIQAGLPPRARRRLPWTRILLWPFALPHPGVERISNIRYGDAGRANLLDVYRGRSRPSRCPVLIHVHGGAFRIGKKSREARPLFYRLAREGWVCVSANYRLRTRFPDPLVDLKKVIAWVREHGPEYGADPGLIVVAGSSAGGYLASMAALTANDPSLQPGFEDADTSVAAVVSLYGYYGPTGSSTQPTSPMALEANGAPPFLVIHPDRDTLVIPEDARRFVEHLRRTSPSPVVYAELPGAQHAFDFFYSIRFETVIDGIVSFAASVTPRS